MLISDDIKKRQQRLYEAMDKESIAIVCSADEHLRTPLCNFRFRQNSEFYYLTGFNEPKAVAIFMPQTKGGKYILFNQERDPLTTIWTGEVAGQEGALKDYAADESFSIEKLEKMLPKLLANKSKVYFGGNVSSNFFKRLMTWLEEVELQKRHGLNIPRELIALGAIVDEMRIRKSAEEIEIMRRSGEISADAHIRAMKATKPGKYEYEIEAEIMYEFIRSGGRDPGYDSIVAGGKNACILHYMTNNQKLNDGDLLLVDAGVEYKNYGTDITRTFPVNGKFTKEQGLIYQAVLDTQNQVIDAVRPGVTWYQLQELSERIVSEKLIELGILSGTVEEVLSNKTFARFYMHRIGHWLGLDNKDAGKYKIGEKEGWRKLEEGIVLTVEPGIYIAAGSEGVDKKWWNIGVRIEDDIVVTKDGCEVLTSKVPKEIDEIESLMR